MSDKNLRNRNPMIGNYRICRKLGGGGEGLVYLVQHIPTEQLRAAKVMRTEDPDRQMHELNMLKRLHHPGLPQIIDVFRIEGRIWLIMEYISGRELSGLSGGEITAPEFFQTAKVLAEVLIYLHSRDDPVLHLDIKPSNVLLKPDGQLVLIDFGASVLSEDSGRNVQFGTPGFASPEQLRGGAAVLDRRADIYGFGATMYYYLYGCIPGSRNAADRGRGPFWKRRITLFLEKCLQEDRERRYSDFSVLYRELCRIEKWYHRRKQIGSALIAAVFLVLVLLFSAASLLRGTELGRTAGTEREYGRLLEMASGMGFSQALSCYKEAAELQPSGQWSLLLLERIMEDYLFTPEEEQGLKELIYSVVPGTGQTMLEVMQEGEGIYGEFAYRLGLSYWYFYQEPGGKSAAASWFSQALVYQKSQPSAAKWQEAASIYADIGSYYEKLGRQDEAGIRQADFQTYWKDLKHLWSLDSLQQELAGIRRQVISELFSCLIMGAYEIRQSGEPPEEIEEFMEEAAAVVKNSELWPDEQEKEVILKQYQDAAAAMERVFADERGQEFDTGQEPAENETE